MIIFRYICMSVMAAFMFISTLQAQVPDFDQFFGAFNPPDYIPIDVATDFEGNIYVLDIYHERVRKFDQNSNLLVEFYFEEKEAEFDWLRAIVVDSDGNIYIADAPGGATGVTNKAGIYKFAPDGSFISLWPEASRGLGIDANDNIYASNQLTDQVTVYDTDGNVQRVIGAGVLIDPEDADADADGNIYVADSGHGRIAKFDSNGNFLMSWGRIGSDPLEFSNPVSVSVDQNNNVFVTDKRNYKIKKFTPTGNFLGMVGDQGEGEALFEEPHGLTVDLNGNVWLAAYHGHDVQKFDNDLNYVSKIEGNRGLGDAEFMDVRGVGVDSQKNVYVSDKWSQKVTKFDPDGNFILNWGRRGQGEAAEFNFPRTIHIDINDNVYVSDDGHIRKFDTQGNYITRYGKYLYIQGLATDTATENLYMSRTINHKVTVVNQVTLEEWSFGTLGSGPGQFNQPWGMAIGPNNKLYIADSGNSRVQVFELDGTFIKEWGAWGADPGQFKLVGGLAIDASGNVYVGDLQNDRVQIFDLNGNYLDQWGSSGTAAGNFSRIWSIAADGSDAIYVGDVGNSNAQRFYYDKVLNPKGRPPYTAGDAHGFYIGIDTNDTWHLEWAGDGVNVQTYSGSVTCDGPIDSVVAWQYEANDILNVQLNRFSFEGIARPGRDGVRFAMQPSTQCDFELLIDGLEKSQHVFVGETLQNPVNLPMSLIDNTVDGPVEATLSTVPAVGAPSYIKGTDFGLYFWYDETRMLWRLRGSSDGLSRKFNGVITTDGTINSFQRIATETKDFTDQLANTITFDLRVTTHQDGFDFAISGGTQLVLDVYIDDAINPEKVIIGQNYQANAIPLLFLIE